MKTVRLGWFLVIFSCLWAGVAWAGQPPPNILLISMDTVRADHVHCGGYPRETTPTFDALAAEGVVFEDCVSATSWTLPSHMTMLTGLMPSDHGAWDVKTRLSETVATVPDLLKKRGYATGAVVSGPWLKHDFGCDRGFEHYDDFSVFMNLEMNLFDENPAPGQSVHEMHTSADVADLAIRWMKEHRDKPFFLFVHLFDPHYDYDPPPPLDKKFGDPESSKENGRNIHSRDLKGMAPADLQRLIDLYDGEIFFTDSHAGRVLKALDELGLKGQTLVILTSDHGEEFAEHGGSKHGCTLFQEVMRVPLVLRLPNGAMAGKRIAERVSLMDLAPTILGACGVEKPAAMTGWNLCGLLDGKPVPERFLFGEVREIYQPPAGRARRDLVCAWKGNLKAIYDAEADQISLFNLKTDRAEMHDLSADGGEKCEEFRRELTRLWYACTQARLERAKESVVAGQPSGKSQTLRLLRGLGYTE